MRISNSIETIETEIMISGCLRIGEFCFLGLEVELEIGSCLSESMGAKRCFEKELINWDTVRKYSVRDSW